MYFRCADIQSCDKSVWRGCDAFQQAHRENTMAQVILKNVKKVYPGNVLAVTDVNLDINDKEFMVLVGPSGCGKSTTLRMIAGLEEISSGTIEIGDRIVNDVPPKDRDIAMVFQNYALYPHMSVYDNIAFGLKLRKYPKNEIEQRVKDAAGILGIADLLDRKPKALSGGQRQRVALGRTIVRKPAAFLLDEPLSNLDAKMRVSMRKELNLLHHRIQGTFIYVTHDQVEAMTLGTRICVMNNAHIQQVGKPIGVYDNPANKFVAGFIGTPPTNFFEGRITQSGGEFFFRNEHSRLKLDERLALASRDYVDKPVTFGVRPEDLMLSRTNDASSESERFPGEVQVVEKLGDVQLIYLKQGDTHFVIKAESHQAVELDTTIWLRPNLSKSHLFAGDEEGRNLGIRS